MERYLLIQSPRLSGLRVVICQGSWTLSLSPLLRTVSFPELSGSLPLWVQVITSYSRMTTKNLKEKTGGKCTLVSFFSYCYSRVLLISPPLPTQVGVTPSQSDTVWSGFRTTIALLNFTFFVADVIQALRIKETLFLRRCKAAYGASTAFLWYS